MVFDPFSWIPGFQISLQVATISRHSTNRILSHAGDGERERAYLG